MLIEEGYSYDDLMLIPQHGVLKTRRDADISSRAYPNGFYLNVPIISANMPSITEGKMAIAMERSGGIGAIHRFNTIEEQKEQYKIAGFVAIISIGIKDGIERTAAFSGSTFFLLDVAHGDSLSVVNFVEKWKERYPHKNLMVGNIATGSGALELVDAGADALKVGIGPGAACTTREVTGFGMPQLSAISECSHSTRHYDVTIVADGGIRNSGDIVKALAAGADSVMVGRLFSNCIETPSPGYYWGNASKKMNGHNAPEGESGVTMRDIKDLESVSDVMKRLAWGIRSGISYAGATNLKELRENARWVKVTPGTLQESRARI